MSEPNITPHTQQDLAAWEGQAPDQSAGSQFLEKIKGKRESAARIGAITIKHKEAKFLLPDGELEDEVAGYPIYYFQTRSFYKHAYRAGQKGTPPDCWSADMIVPHPSIPVQQRRSVGAGDECFHCPYSEFGTARDWRSKACAETLWIFLVSKRYGDPPIAYLKVPPSSLRVMLGTRFQPGYFSTCEKRHKAYEIVWTKLRLEKAGADGDQVVYSTLKPIMGPAVPVDTPAGAKMIERLAYFHDHFEKLFQELRQMPPEAVEKDDEDDGTDSRDAGEEG